MLTSHTGVRHDEMPSVTDVGRTGRALLTASGFAERNLCGTRWSYTLNAIRVTPLAA